MILGGYYLCLPVCQSPPPKSPKKARADASPDPSSARTKCKKISRGFAKSFPPENSFGKTESALKPHHLPEALRAESRKKCSHPFRRKNQSRANPKSKEHFFAGHASGASGGGAIHSAILEIGSNLVQ